MDETDQVTRREFLKLSAAAAVGLACNSLVGGCGGGPIIEPLAAASPTAARASVAAVRGTNLYAMTREALAAIGGIETVVGAGETVFIKPNFLTVGRVAHNPFEWGECTKPEILLAVAEECLKAGASEVTIGDGAQVTRFAWDQIITLDGSTSMTAAAERLNSTYDGNVVLASLNADSPDWDRLPCPGTSLETISVSSLVARADRVISVPVLKTHRTMHVTLSLKNFIGSASLKEYDIGLGYRSLLHLATGGVQQCSLNIVNGVKPDLAIIDGSIGCEGYGPFVGGGNGDRVDMKDRLGSWLMLASTDLVAADATAARIIGHDVSDVTHLAMAYEQGMGQIREDKIDIIGADLSDLQVTWKPSPTGGLFGITKRADDGSGYGSM